MYVITFTDSYDMKRVRLFDKKEKCQEWLDKFGDNELDFKNVCVFRVVASGVYGYGDSELITPVIKVITTEKKVWNL